MRGSEVSVPEGPHAVKSTASLSISRGFSVIGMLHMIQALMLCGLYSVQVLERMVISAGQYTLQSTEIS